MKLFQQWVLKKSFQLAIDKYANVFYDKIIHTNLPHFIHNYSKLFSYNKVVVKKYLIRRDLE